MTSETYLNLCTQVYDLSKPHPPEDVYAFYRSYAAKVKGPILEPMERLLNNSYNFRY